MMKLFVFIFLFLQQNDLIKISSSVDRNVVRIGDKIRYTVSIEYDKSIDIQIPGQGINLGYFEVKDYKIKEPVFLGNKIREVYEYTISTYDTGHYAIPPFPVGYFKKGDKESFKLIEAPEQQLFVKSIFLNDSVINEQPRDIKNPLEIPYTSLWWVYLLGTIILLASIYFIFIRFFKKEKIEEEKIVTPLEAHEIALLELDKVNSFSSTNPDDINIYYTCLSFILRNYLENRFQIPAVEETATELRESLQKISVSSTQYDWLVNIIDVADLVKFAKELPKQDDFKHIYDEIKSFILDTKLEKTNEAKVS